MNRRYLTRIGLLSILLAAGCSDNDLVDPVVPGPEAVLFHEPQAFCFADSIQSKALFVFNLGDGPLDWNPTDVPDGVVGLGPLTVDPQSVTQIDWSWAPSGPYPVRDTLIVTTSDPDQPQVVIPLRAEDPAGFTDVTPPPAPVPLLPAEGAEFAVADTILIAWSELDDCSGIQFYRLDISTSPTFTNIVCCSTPITDSATQVIVDPGDEGTAFWRVYGVDGANLRGLPSATGSWVVR